MSVSQDELAQMTADDDGWGCAITRTPSSRPSCTEGALTAYLNAKDRYEHLAFHVGSLSPRQRRTRDQAEAEVDAMKKAAGNGGPDDPLCCQRYSFLHHPSFSVTGCRWYGYRAQTATT